MNSVLYISQKGTSGYAISAKYHIFELMSNKVQVAWKTVEIGNNTNGPEMISEFESYLEYTKKIIVAYDTVIIHCMPTHWDTIIDREMINVTKKTVIGRMAWEFSKLPEEYVASINDSLVKSVSVPSEFCRAALKRSGVTKPISVDPHPTIKYTHKKYGLNHILSKSTSIFRNKLSDEDLKGFYKFYTIEEFSVRKNLEQTIRTFCETFTNRDKVILFIKTHIHDYSQESEEKCLARIVEIVKNYSNNPPIVYVRGILNEDEIDSLHCICDCYVSSTRSEGFGLGIHKALSKGNELVVNGYGGHIEYIPKENLGVVDDFTLVSAPKLHIDGVELIGYEWADINQSTFSRKMLEVFNLDANKIELSSYRKIEQSINKSILEQSEFPVKILNFPYSKTNQYLNSSIFKVQSKKYIAVRHATLQVPKQEFDNKIEIYELDGSYDPIRKVNIKLVDEVEREQYEDPRVLVNEDRIYISCANYSFGNSKAIHQKVIVMNHDFDHISNIHPVYNGNEKTCLLNLRHQKNWTWFVGQDNLIYCVYAMNPHTVLQFDPDGSIQSEYKTYVDINKIWGFGECRMGSTPIFKDGAYHNFFHSSLPWKGFKRQYFMGYYSFEATPPFRIIKISKEPILYGNTKDERLLPDISPLVIFPTGAILENDKFVVSFGLNDERTGIITI